MTQRGKQWIRGLLTIALLLSFKENVPSAQAPSRESAIPTVSFCQLQKAPGTFNGKTIRITAVYLYGFEVSRLLPTHCCEDLAEWTWVELGDLDRTSRKLTRRFPKDAGMVLGTFIGKFEDGGYPQFQGARYRLTITAVEHVEDVSRIGTKKKPAWAPPFCSK